MTPDRCDRCGMDLPLTAARYRAVLEIAHAADTLVITEDDLRQDHRARIREVLEEMERWDPRQLEEDVYVRRERRLCPRCRAEVLAALDGPRPRPKRRPRGGRRRRR